MTQSNRCYSTLAPLNFARHLVSSYKEFRISSLEANAAPTLLFIDLWCARCVAALVQCCGCVTATPQPVPLQLLASLQMLRVTA